MSIFKTVKNVKNHRIEIFNVSTDPRLFTLFENESALFRSPNAKISLEETNLGQSKEKLRFQLKMLETQMIFRKIHK